MVCLQCRCVLNWFGDWSTGALFQVGKEFTSRIDLEKSNVSFMPCYLITPVCYSLRARRVNVRFGRVLGRGKRICKDTLRCV